MVFKARSLWGRVFLIELEFGRIELWKEKNQRTRTITLGARKRTNNKLNPHMTPGPGIKPGTHWWEASALTTAPSLLPKSDVNWEVKLLNSCGSTGVFGFDKGHTLNLRYLPFPAGWRIDNAIPAPIIKLRSGIFFNISAYWMVDGPVLV